MRPIIIGTAGHIDHGKSSLIRALTGTDPDRLAEEKQRGMTIDIGFAFLNENIAFIDVPGHEKYIKNMVTGASTINIGLLVIAADDGIMPQTREHFDIFRLLNVKQGLIIITKTDLADPDWIDLVEEEIREYVRKSFLENAQVFRVSSTKGTGIAELKEYILKLLKTPDRQTDDGDLFRLLVDRVFSVKGHGTVVTGTIISGELKVGQDLELLPSRKIVKVRGIQSHNVDVQNLGVGHRGAINIQGIEHSAVKRGDFLASPGSFKISSLLTCSVKLLPMVKTLKYNSIVRVHIGTGEYLAKIRLIGRDRLSPGESAIAQLIFEQPLSAGFRDRFIIRQYSPMVTIGGGVVMDVMAKPLRKKDHAIAEAMEYLLSDVGTELISRYLDLHPFTLFNDRELSLTFTISVSRVQRYLAKLTIAGNIIQVGKFWTSPRLHDKIKADILKAIIDFHTGNPLISGILHLSLLETVKIPVELMNFFLKQLADEHQIILSSKRIAMSGFRIEFSDVQQKFIETLESDLKQGEFNPPNLKEIHQRSPLSEKDVQLVIAFLLDENRIVQVDRDKFIYVEIIKQGRNQIREYLVKNQSATVSELKDVLNTSRKWAIPILNYYDKIGLTTRIGDRRVLSLE